MLFILDFIDVYIILFYIKYILECSFKFFFLKKKSIVHNYMKMVIFLAWLYIFFFLIFDVLENKEIVCNLFLPLMKYSALSDS